ncbi:MAG TPA: ABC transporter permease, partial [Gemmatimonadales bacterium]|nr:ABC transporter permease [Gemmatimonadales bacterium]
MPGINWGVRGLRRHPLRAALSLAGIAVATAMLLDMVMLSGGLDRSFEDLLLLRGYQIRLTPRGTLPFDTEAMLGEASDLIARVRADPGVVSAAPVLGATVYARRADSLRALVGYGIDPAEQGLYQLERGSDLTRGDTTGVLLSAPAADALGLGPGDSIRLAGQLDPQIASAAVDRVLAVRGIVRFLYDYQGQRSVATVLPLMQRLSHRSGDPVSLVLVKARTDSGVASVTARLAAELPDVQVSSVGQLVEQFRHRMLYFRQLSYILGTMSLIVTVLLVATLLTINVSERLGEIATLRAIGISRRTVVNQVMTEGAVLTIIGGGFG